ncbi:GroES-like protein [Astrocystis sublimbata]|nr:GroES-like protein [Astrocystis sublimbata]KAI0193523.1 GroES-like protein [Astrocystis sublimbata]KAI0197705.1 GroES-like protein [Astrocystis sublimbata]
MAAAHRAAILPQKGGPLSIEDRATPSPGPNEVLIEVKAVALNIVDCYQRDYGTPPVHSYPAVVGNDASGIIAKAGAEVSSRFPVGSRVLALATCFFSGSPDNGAFQKYVLAPSEAVALLPDSITMEEGAVFPLVCMTALTAWTVLGIPLDTKYAAEDKQAVLIWGGSSGVGTYAIQSAKLMGFTVYATASPQHHAYLKSLGAHAVFDYKASDVVSQIASAAQKDGVQLHTAHCAVSDSLQPTLDVLAQTKGSAAAKVAHSPVLPPEHPTLDNTEIVFVFPPTTDPAAVAKHIVLCSRWLQDGLDAGSVVPSPHVQVEEGGLEGLNAAMDKLKAGVSGTKIVVPI